MRKAGDVILSGLLACFVGVVYFAAEVIYKTARGRPEDISWTMLALALLIGLTVFYVRGQKGGKLRDGDTCLVFLLLYGASQVVLDSTRYDSLFFRSNGFVSVVQVLGALALVLAMILFSRRMVKARGFRAWQIFLWLLIAIAIAGAGYMEYYVQRRGNEALFANSVMSGCLAVVIALTLLIRSLAVRVERKYHGTGG